MMGANKNRQEGGFLVDKVGRLHRMKKLGGNLKIENNTRQNNSSDEVQRRPVRLSYGNVYEKIGS